MMIAGFFAFGLPGVGRHQKSVGAKSGGRYVNIERKFWVRNERLAPGRREERRERAPPVACAPPPVPLDGATTRAAAFGSLFATYRPASTRERWEDTSILCITRMTPVSCRPGWPLFKPGPWLFLSLGGSGADDTKIAAQHIRLFIN